MYLKSLTLKGFKSFASSTTLQLEPGITCIVGPNGSGKSNVVDALAWVMGEQGAKSLRGGKMEDVIFAGTSGRPPLGRAEVLLTIDNTDGALPIEYAEVTISRTMFRNGGSEYAINGNPCRLLDVQELLSDSGIGREMHVIVGQGQLDTILHATPEDRRGLHRGGGRRTQAPQAQGEGAPQAGVDRRQPDPAQPTCSARSGASSSRWAGRPRWPAGPQSVQADVRDARARLMADDLATARTALEQELADESVLLERRAEVEQALAATRETRGRARGGAARGPARRWPRAQETWFGLSGLRERLRGTAGLAAERVRNAASQPEVPDGARPRRARGRGRTGCAPRRQEITAEVEGNRTALEGAVSARQAAEHAFAEEERRVAGLQRAAADRREGMARLHGQVNGLRSRAAAAEEEVGRLTEARADGVARAERAQHDFTSLESRVAGLDAGEEGLDSEHEAASSLLSDIEDRLAKTPRGAHRRRARALVAERPQGGPRAGPQPQGRRRRAARGHRLGQRPARARSPRCSACAPATRRPSPPRSAVPPTRSPSATSTPRSAPSTTSRTTTSAAPGILLGGADVDDTAWPGLPDGRGLRHGRRRVPRRPACPRWPRLLFKVAVVDDLAAARGSWSPTPPDVTAVTRDGDLLGAHFAAGGSSSQPSLIEVQAAVDEATEQLGTAAHTLERLTFDVATLEREREEARRRVDVALARLHESDATLAAVAEELGQYGSQARNARAEADRLDQAIAAAKEARDRDLAGARRAGVAARERRGRPRGGARHHRARAARRGGARGPRGRDGGAARAAHRRGAGARPARPRRLAAPGCAGRARRPRGGDRPPRAAAARGPRRRGGRPRARPSCSPGSRSRSRRPPPSAPASSRAAPAASRSCARPANGCATSAATSTSWSTPCTATRWPAPSSGCGSSSSRSARSRSSGSTPTRWSPTTAPTS